MLKKVVLGILIVILVVILFFVFRWVTRPENPSADEVRDQLLIEVPIGSHEDEVRALIESQRHWEITVEREMGISGRDISDIFRNVDWSGGDMSHDTVVLDIEVDMEVRMEGIFHNSQSYAIWRFDKDGRLVDIITIVRIHNSWF